MKVLIINPILYTCETDNNGDEPVLAAADCYKPTEKEEYPFEVFWFSCVFPKVFKPRCFPCLKQLGRYVREHKSEFDYIISGEVFSLATLVGVLNAKKKMIIWHELGNHNRLMKKIPSKIWYNVVTKIFLQNVPIVPRSERAAAFIGKYCNYVLPIRIDHGIELEKICYSREKENYFVVLSQLIERKHIDEIVYRFAEFRKENYENYQLKIIGDGILREKLEKQVQNLKEENNIQFLGKLDHETLMPILAKAKALLVNTSKDNSMVSIVESIGAGTPIITTSVPFNVSYIKSEALGIVKDGWSKNELIQICKDNTFYVENCLNYRKRLSNEYCAKQFNQVGGLLK